MLFKIFPHEYHMEAKGCGPTCLKIIAKFYGKYYFLQYFRDKCGITREGASFNDLWDNIKSWEQKYVFKAPMDGRVEFLKFLTNNQFIQAGEEIFSIVPEKNTILGQMLLPATGAGKVETASPVIIKLDNYPYMEYGSVEGQVSSISLVTKEEQIANTNIETYLIAIELPKGLTTNYGKKLDFKYEIKGTAEIIVNDRRLIERLFDNLKYRVK